MEGFLKQSTAVNITVLMVDSSDHITGKTGLTLTIYATKAAGTPTVITPTVTELDSTNAKGIYKLAFTTGHTDTLGELQLHITSSGADPADYKWQVSTYLPGEAASLQADQAVNVTKWNGTAVAAPATAGIPEVNVKNIANTAQTARDIGASVLLSAGSGAGQLDFTSGVVKANLAQVLGTALTETAGQIAAAFKQFFNIASPTSTMNVITTVTTATTATNLTNAPTAGDFTATMKTSLNAATPASVTGAVGSVAGNVGGNVVGSVGSVVATVAANLTQILGTVLTETSGQIAAAFKKFFNIATPAATMDHGILVDTVTTYTGNTPQTGDAFARLGVAGVGLTNLGDTRIAHLDADISTRTKPADTQAAVTLVTTTTNLTANNDKTGYTLSNTGMDNLLDRSNGVETGFTLRQAMRLVLSALCGKLSGGNTTSIAIRDVNDTVDRIAATVDANGNRTAVTLTD